MPNLIPSRNRFTDIFLVCLTFALTTHIVTFVMTDTRWYVDLSWQKIFTAGVIVAGTIGAAVLIVLSWKSRSVEGSVLVVATVLYSSSIFTIQHINAKNVYDSVQMNDRTYYFVEGRHGIMEGERGKHNILLQCDDDAWRLSNCDPCWYRQGGGYLDRGSMDVVQSNDAETLVVTVKYDNHGGGGRYEFIDIAVYELAKPEQCLPAQRYEDSPMVNPLQVQ